MWLALRGCCGDWAGSIMTELPPELTLGIEIVGIEGSKKPWVCACFRWCARTSPVDRLGGCRGEESD